MNQTLKLKEEGFLPPRIKFIIFAGLMIGILFLSFQYYQHREMKQSEVASNHYETLLSAIQKKEMNTVKEKADILIRDYSKTPYAPLALFTLSKIAIEENNFPLAISHLQDALKLTGNKKGPLQHASRTRLAKVLVAEKKYDEALSLLENQKAIEGYVTLYEELKGDIYLKQNQLDKAKIAFKLAKEAAPNGMPISRLELKLADLGN